MAACNWLPVCIGVLVVTTAACGGSGEDPSQSSDVTQSSSTANIYVATSAKPGGGDIAELITVKLVDRKTTRCDDGKLHATCTIESVNLDALRLSATNKSKLDAAFKAGHALLRGELVPRQSKGIGGLQVVELVATQAWIGAKGHAPAAGDQYYRVNMHAVDSLCKEPSECSLYSQYLVNSTKAPTGIANVDLSKTGATATQLKTADGLMKLGAPGLLVLGHNDDSPGKPLVATDFFLPDGVEACDSVKDCSGNRGVSGCNDETADDTCSFVCEYDDTAHGFCKANP